MEKVTLEQVSPVSVITSVHSIHMSTVSRKTGGSWWRSRYSDLLPFGRYENRILVGARFFRTHPDRPGVPPRPLYNGYRAISGSKTAGAWL